jgi:hypothetical protein
MRISYQNIDQPKHMAKLLARATDKSLMACQQALATASGYRDWFELSAVTSGLSEDCSAASMAVEGKVRFVLQIAEPLEADACDVQFAVSQMNTFKWHSGMREQLEIRSRLLRMTTIPDLGRHQPGAIGKFKYDSRPLILRSFGSLVSAVGDSSHDYGVADFEFVTPRKPLPLFVPGRLYFAYGAWTEANGSIVLHSRDYLPLWRISEGKRPERVNPADWIDHEDELDQWFWEDATCPWDNPKRQAQEIGRLESYGVTGLPYLADTLADIVHPLRPLNPRGAAQLRFGVKSNRPHLHRSAS